MAVVTEQGAADDVPAGDSRATSQGSVSDLTSAPPSAPPSAQPSVSEEFDVTRTAVPAVIESEEAVSTNVAAAAPAPAVKPKPRGVNPIAAAAAAATQKARAMGVRNSSCAADDATGGTDVVEVRCIFLGFLYFFFFHFLNSKNGIGRRIGGQSRCSTGIGQEADTEGCRSPLLCLITTSLLT